MVALKMALTEPASRHTRTKNSQDERMPRTKRAVQESNSRSKTPSSLEPPGGHRDCVYMGAANTDLEDAAAVETELNKQSSTTVVALTTAL